MTVRPYRPGSEKIKYSVDRDGSFSQLLTQKFSEPFKIIIVSLPDLTLYLRRQGVGVNPNLGPTLAAYQIPFCKGASPPLGRKKL